MSKERLAHLLHQLHIELADADDLDEELSDKLRTATAEIHQALERDEAGQAGGEPPVGVIDQLRQAANRFEDSHPAITNTVGRIADALAGLGI